MRNFRLTIILLTFNLIIFGFIYYENKITNKESIVSKVSDFDLNDINSLKISTPAGDFVFEKNRGDFWQILTPVVWPANKFAIGKILSNLQFLEKNVSFSSKELSESGHVLSNYGLDNPFISICLSNSRKQNILKVGKVGDYNPSFYLYDQNKDKIFILDNNFIDILSQNLDQFRENRLFEFNPFEIKELIVKSNDFVVLFLKKYDSQAHPEDQIARQNSQETIQKNNNQIDNSEKTDQILNYKSAKFLKNYETFESNWHLEIPIQVRANDRVLNSFLSQISNLTAKKFLNEKEIDLSKCGLVVPQMKLIIKGNSREEILWIGNSFFEDGKKQYFSKLESNSSVFLLEGNLIERLKEGQTILRERKLLFFEPEKITGIEISREFMKINLQKLETKKWQVLYDKNGKNESFALDETVLENIFSALENSSALSFENDAPSAADLESFGLLDEKRYIKLLNHSEKTLILGNSTDDSLYVKLKNEPFVYKIPNLFLNFFPQNPFFYRERNLWHLNSNQIIESITIETIDKNLVWNYQLNNMNSNSEIIKSEDKFAVEKSSELQFNEKVFHEMSNLIRNFKTGEILGEFNDQFCMSRENSSIPWKYIVKIKFDEKTLISQKKDQSIEIFMTGRTGGDFQFGGLKNENLSFKLSIEMIDCLQKIFARKNIQKNNK